MTLPLLGRLLFAITYDGHSVLTQLILGDQSVVKRVFLSRRQTPTVWIQTYLLFGKLITYAHTNISGVTRHSLAHLTPCAFCTPLVYDASHLPVLNSASIGQSPVTPMA